MTKNRADQKPHPFSPFGKIQSWIKARKEAGHDEFPFVRIDPKDNVIFGLDQIKAYLGIRSHVTLYRWIELYGLPVVRRPDGIWLTTITAIDQWIFLAAEVDNENRPWSRGTNSRFGLAKKRLEDRLREAEEMRQNGGRSLPKYARRWYEDEADRNSRSRRGIEDSLSGTAGSSEGGPSEWGPPASKTRTV